MYLISLITEIIFFLQILLSKSQRETNDNFIINLTIEGKGYQAILGDNTKTPLTVIINGQTQDYPNILYEMKENINNITVIWDERPSCSKMFKNVGNVISVDLSLFNSSYETDTSEMFSGCINLKYINFTGFYFSFVDNMDKMFYDCVKLVSLDLSNFYSQALLSMESMFENDESLLFLNLINFDISKVTNMKRMFYNCNSLVYINFDTLTESESEDIDIEYLISNNNAIIYCIQQNDCPKIYSFLDSNGFENDCDNLCFKQNRKIKAKEKICVESCDNGKNVFEINGICYENEENENTIIEENSDISEKIKFSSENFFKESFQNEESSNKDEIINSLREDIIKGNLGLLLSGIINGTKQDLIAKFKDISYQITTTGNQKNNIYNNISTIDLGDCEDILKDKYKINQNLSLIIFKIDYYIDGLLIPIVCYEVYHPTNYSQLDLNLCNETLIKLHIPVEIDEEKLYKYDPTSDYYNDECFAYTTENGTDIILNDRKNEYIENNLSLCENNCTYNGYSIAKKKASCECETKIKIDLISKLLEEENYLSNYFDITENSNVNIGTMKCISLLFSKNGLIKNIGSYILFISLLILLLSITIVYKCGMDLHQNDINKIVNLKKHKKKKEMDIFNYDKKSSTHRHKKLKKTISSPNKKKVNMRNNIHLNKEIERSKRVYLSSSRLEIKNNLTNIYKEKSNKKENIIVDNENKIKQERNIISFLNYKDIEIYTLSFNETWELNKKVSYEYYFYLIKTKIPFLFAFYPIDDYNLKIIKICLFFLFFDIYFAVNTFFFNETTIHNIYKNRGKYDFLYFFPQIIYSFLISYFTTSFIKYFSLSERNILEIKNEKNKDNLNDKIEAIKRCLVLKYILFFIISFVFIIVFWFYLSSFCAVYKNTQIYLIINTLISLTICIIFIITFNLLPCLLRNLSLQKNKPINELIFKISKIIQKI